MATYGPVSYDPMRDPAAATMLALTRPSPMDSGRPLTIQDFMQLQRRQAVTGPIQKQIADREMTMQKFRMGMQRQAEAQRQQEFENELKIREEGRKGESHELGQKQKAFDYEEAQKKAAHEEESRTQMRELFGGVSDPRVVEAAQAQQRITNAQRALMMEQRAQFGVHEPGGAKDPRELRAELLDATHGTYTPEEIQALTDEEVIRYANTYRIPLVKPGVDIPGQLEMQATRLDLALQDAQRRQADWEQVHTLAEQERQMMGMMVEKKFGIRLGPLTKDAYEMLVGAGRQDEADYRRNVDEVLKIDKHLSDLTKPDATGVAPKITRPEDVDTIAALQYLRDKFRRLLVAQDEEKAVRESANNLMRDYGISR